MHGHDVGDDAAAHELPGGDAPAGEERAVGALNVGDVRLPPGFRATGHTHVQLHWSFVVSGGLIERDGTRDRELHAAHSRFSPAGDLHDLVVGPGGARCLIVEFDRDWAAASSARFPDDRRYCANPAFEVLSRQLGREAFSVAPSRLSVEGLGLELLAAVRRIARPRADLRPPRWLARVRERLHDSCTDTAGLGDLAREAGVHPMHLTRAFRAHFGCSVGDYQLRLRLDRARVMLLRTDLAIASVAAETGFADQSHLTMLMKRELGITPLALRRSSARAAAPREASIVQDGDGAAT